MPYVARLIALTLLLALRLPAQVVAIKAGKLIDTESGSVLSNQTVVIRDGKVEAVGSSVRIPDGAKVIDLSNMTVLPGLIDCHTHLADPGVDGDPRTILFNTAVDEAYSVIPNPRTVLMAGFTTVRDVGVYRALTDIAMRDAINKGIFVGPRMYAAGSYITITGGAGAMTGISPDVTLPLDLRMGEANSPWEVRQKVRLLVSQRVDLIKVLASGAVLTHNSNKNSREFTPDELSAAVDEAKSFGLKVAAHAHSAEGIKNAVRAGVASIEHGTYLDDEGIRLMKERGTYLVPTLDVHSCVESSPKTPPDFLEHNKGTAEAHYNGFKKAVQGGVRIAFGTDVPVCPFGDNAKEFEYMVRYGMTPMQAIQAATMGGATLIGVDKQVGSLKPGKLADVIAVSGDPIQDIKTLQSVAFVMKGGQIFKQ
jgi:imidazolonepropionase-like amidohydrolase